MDKIPLMTLGHGLSVAQDGQAFKWNSFMAATGPPLTS